MFEKLYNDKKLFIKKDNFQILKLLHIAYAETIEGKK